MFELNRTSDIGGDETAEYEVILDKEYTVKSFIDTILLNKNEWGEISIEDGETYEYRYGKLLSKLGGENLDKKVIEVNSVGGWSLMNYFINI